jgi:DNA polymerase III delta prime subunit
VTEVSKPCSYTRFAKLLAHTLDLQVVFASSATVNFYKLNIAPVLTNQLKNLTDVNNDSSVERTTVQPVEELSGVFVGRQQESKRLHNWLVTDQRQRLLIVLGSAGVGKTAFVLKVAGEVYGISQENNHHEVIFVSFKNRANACSHFQPSGVSLPDAGVTLLVKEIFGNLKIPPKEEMYTQESLTEVYKVLAAQSTLIIVDGLEDVSLESSTSILNFLGNIPTSSKAIITTRKSKLFYSRIYRSIELKPLSLEDSFLLVSKMAQKKGLSIPSTSTRKIYELSNGVPMAIISAVVQYAIDPDLKCLSKLFYNKSDNKPSDMSRIAIDSSVMLLEQELSCELLIAMSFFREAPSYSCLLATSGLIDDEMSMEKSVKELKDLLLVSKYESGGHFGYRLSPIIREYVESHLSSRKENFEQEARNRWVNWYREFAKKYSEDIHKQIVCESALEHELENIGEVLVWCAKHDNYEIIKEIWNAIDPYILEHEHWIIRFYWWDYLEKESEKRSEISTYVEAILQKTETWMKIDSKHIEEVKQFFEKALRYAIFTDQNIRLKIESCRQALESYSAATRSPA